MLDGTGGSSWNLTYTCMVEMIPGLYYITWKSGLKEGNLENNPLDLCNEDQELDLNT